MKIWRMDSHARRDGDVEFFVTKKVAGLACKEPPNCEGDMVGLR
jgi:hypothetical protein